MRLILVDREEAQRQRFYPLSLSRPIWELRFGMTTLAEKLLRACGAQEVACFVPDYLAAAYRRQTAWPVNDPATLRDDELLLVNPRLKAAELAAFTTGPSRVATDAEGRLLVARLDRGELTRQAAGSAPKNAEPLLAAASIDALVAAAAEQLPREPKPPATWDYIWDLVLANAAQLAEDFVATGRSGIEGRVEEPSAVRGDPRQVYVAPGAVVHPWVVIDAEHGPVYLDENCQIHPFTRIEGPCYVGRNSILLGAKCREGNTIGPQCRIGGEVEESIVHGYTNKYHDGFLGHAYVGEWVNLGAGTTNSDLKNDYSSVAVILDGRHSVDTGSPKVGALIGDHTKSSIGTLFNTGTCVGAMAILASPGKLLPKFIPSFAWLLDGVVTKGFGKRKLFETARIAMGRRGCTWDEADEALWEAVYALTAPLRDEAVRRGRRQLAAAQGT